MARDHYLKRAAELGPDADARIFAEARADGGVLADGESIDLSQQAAQMGIRRDVLEAIVLMLRRREGRLSSPVIPVVVVPAQPPPPEPPPASNRLGPISTPDVFEIVGYTNSGELYLAYFRFPDRATMNRCVAPLGLGETPSPNPIPLRRVGLEMIVHDLDLIIRLEPEETGALGAKDAEAAREVAHALAGLELLQFCVSEKSV